MFQLFAELIAFHIDAAERLKRSESRLLGERATAELREEFIGVLGHDLRSPLGAISMGTHLLAMGTQDEARIETVEMMQRSVARMSDLIDDAMDFTRGRLGGGIPVDLRTDHPLKPLLRQVMEETRALWPNREIATHLTLEDGVRFDRRRLAQLFSTLLSNAITHGRPDTLVTVRAMCNGGKFDLSVANAADPIPPAKRERLFEPFSRGGKEDYR